MELLASTSTSRRTSERRLMDAVQIDYQVTPFRAQRFYDIYWPVIRQPLTYGATSYLFYRVEEDPDHFVHIIQWEDRAGFERWWFSQEMQKVRTGISGFVGQPLTPKWSTILEQG
jgi:hypothetical protein